MAGEEHVQPWSARGKLTYEDFLRFPDDGLRHELIDGEHFVTPAPTLRHQRVIGRLYGAFYDYLRTRPIGEIFLSPADVVLSTHDIVEPDLLYVSQERSGILRPDAVHGPPDLAVEVLSPGTRRVDQRLKLALFDRAGVTEYWILDPDSNTATVYRRGQGGLAVVATLTEADSLTTALLPGLAIDLSGVFG
jgi:Uma2 family endonuclease